MHSSEEATFSHRWSIELRKTYLAWKGLWCPADKQSKLSLLAKWQTCLLNKEDRINYNFALRLTCLCCPLIVLTQITDILITNFLTVSFLLAVLHCRLIAQMYTLSAESHANYHYQHLQPPSSEVLRIPHPFPHSSILAVCSSPPILHTSHTHTQSHLILIMLPPVPTHCHWLFLNAQHWPSILSHPEEEIMELLITDIKVSQIVSGKRIWKAFRVWSMIFSCCVFGDYKIRLGSDSSSIWQ